jgi:large subunit ribosomal protein L28
MLAEFLPDPGAVETLLQLYQGAMLVYLVTGDRGEGGRWNASSQRKRRDGGSCDDTAAAGIAEFEQVPVKSRFALQVLNFLGVVMAQQCDICGKKPQAGNRISHAHNVTKRRWNINLRPVHARVGAATKRMRVCTSCLRSGKVVKA